MSVMLRGVKMGGWWCLQVEMELGRYLRDENFYLDDSRAIQPHVDVTKARSLQQGTAGAKGMEPMDGYILWVKKELLYV